MTPCNGLADGEVDLRDEPEFVDKREGGHGAPQPARAHGFGIVRKGKLNLVRDAVGRVDAEAGEDTQGTGIAGDCVGTKNTG